MRDHVRALRAGPGGDRRGGRGGRLRRLAGAALLPYQAGRMLGYGALGRRRGRRGRSW
ncbi:hypothetical protein [Dankookia sp. P2]|uniref:hypothetical protein n=1 Tax=Dankookia sp. P2 TaxID=3423955 RepID=UPI003D67E4E6